MRADCAVHAYCFHCPSGSAMVCLVPAILSESSSGTPRLPAHISIIHIIQSNELPNLVSSKDQFKDQVTFNATWCHLIHKHKQA